MPRTSLAYRALAQIAVPLVPLLQHDSRQRAAHRARLDAPHALEHWAKKSRDPARPLAWFHASSVGEGLQVRAVMQVLRIMQPEMQFLYTHYSPSAEAFATALDVDWQGYLCYDRRTDVDRMLAAAAPDLLVFGKLDLWPELAVRGSTRGTSVAMVAATVSAASGRLRWPARQLTAPGYAVLDLAATVAAEDAERLVSLGTSPDHIVVAGDPRIDSVLQMIDDADSTASILLETDPAMTLVAGSTWPQDETVVLDAFARVRQRHPLAQLIIAPHDPTAAHLRGVVTAARRAGLPDPVPLSAFAKEDRVPIVTIDRVGLLARLYARGAIAYVGGGFGTKGIHSVLEPAAWSRPVVIGPHDRQSRDACMLDRAGGLQRLTDPESALQLAQIWNAWLDQPALAAGIGRSARQALDAERGAASRSARLLLSLVKVRIPVQG